MPSTLSRELRQQKPFKSLHEEAYLSVVRTETVLRDAFDRVLAERGLSRVQYNILRILRGAGANGLCRYEIGERLVSRMPDVSRRLDHMEQAGLISRVRSTEDRRLVNTTLTPEGLSLVNELDEPVQREFQARLGHMTDDQLQSLIDLLGVARSAG
jgi:DNA-binding MarR family transcriptional regulator